MVVTLYSLKIANGAAINNPVSQVQHIKTLALNLPILISVGSTIAVSRSYVMTVILITLANNIVPKL